MFHDSQFREYIDWTIISHYMNKVVVESDNGVFSCYTNKLNPHFAAMIFKGTVNTLRQKYGEKGLSFQKNIVWDQYGINSIMVTPYSAVYRLSFDQIMFFLKSWESVICYQTNQFEPDFFDTIIMLCDIVSLSHFMRHMITPWDESEMAENIQKVNTTKWLYNFLGGEEGFKKLYNPPL